MNGYNLPRAPFRDSWGKLHAKGFADRHPNLKRLKEVTCEGPAGAALIAQIRNCQMKSPRLFNHLLPDLPGFPPEHS